MYALAFALDNLFEQKRNVAKPILNDNCLYFIQTIIDDTQRLNAVCWNDNKSMLNDTNLNIKNRTELMTYLMGLSLHLQDGDSLVDIFFIDMYKQDEIDVLSEIYYNQDLYGKVENFITKQNDLINNCSTFIDKELYARHKKNQVCMADGGQGVTESEKKVRLCKGLTFIAYDLETSDLVHNSGGDSKIQHHEQTFGPLAQATTVNKDNSSKDGIAFAVANCKDLVGKSTDLNKFAASHKAGLKKVAYINSKNMAELAHGYLCYGSALHCQVYYKQNQSNEEYEPLISPSLDTLINEGMKDKNSPVWLCVKAVFDFLDIHGIRASKCRFSIDRTFCNVRGIQCCKHENDTNQFNAGIMPMPIPKGWNEEKQQFEYINMTEQKIDCMEDIDDFDKYIPLLVISSAINSNIYYWYSLCWPLIYDLQSGEPRWRNIQWPQEISEKILDWRNTVGYDIEQIERHIVHMLHLKRSIIKLKKDHKEKLKIILDKEQEFIVQYAQEILDNDGSCEELKSWYKTQASKLNLTESIVNICAQEIAACVYDDEEEEVNTALDIDISELDNECDEKTSDDSRFTYCICKKQYNCNDIMIKCFSCHEEYHIECMGMTIDEYQILIYEDSKWLCLQKQQCQQ